MNCECGNPIGEDEDFLHPGLCRRCGNKQTLSGIVPEKRKRAKAQRHVIIAGKKILLN